MNPSAPQAAPNPGGMPTDDDQDAGGSTITITCAPDGTYSVSQDDGDDGDEGGEGATPDADDQPVVAKSVKDVLQIVGQMLQASGPGAAWQAEASTRDASGMPSQPSAGPSMSM